MYETVLFGRDINYAALAGAVFPLGPAQAPPLPPLNLLADFGGGGAYLALGVSPRCTSAC